METPTQIINEQPCVFTLTNKGRIFKRYKDSDWELVPPIPFDQFPIEPSNPKEDE